MLTNPVGLSLMPYCCGQPWLPKQLPTLNKIQAHLQYHTSPSAGVPVQTHIKVRLDHVMKKVVVPNEHLKALVDVYRLLHAKGLSTASRASAMKVCPEA
jgi:hypothetical protein